ncbi:hypothetical protein BC943DRAFT_338703 [Umbelopsis sp. AD052]|nr:hypothetical protein BC943DRAFT_338703 [Umbelopsis sp. AD052]
MRLQNLALVAVLLAATANAVPHSKRATCQTDDDCAGVTCCNLNTNLCVNDPNGTICDIAPTKTTTKATTTKATTTKATTTKATTTKTTAKATSTATCTSDDDCPGVTCCNLNTNTCVNDPNNTICDIPPTKITTTKSSTTTKSTTTQPTTTTTTTSHTTTTTKTTTTATATATGVACTTDDDCPGVTCCNLNTNRCVNDPNNTICDIPPTKTLTTTKATTTKATTTTKTTTKTSTTTSGGDIADSEKSAVAFCQSASDAPGAKAFPSGFITSSHFKAATGTAAYVQYTGTINPSLYGLKSSDEGGQYDNHGSGSPPGSVCAGYPYYVNLVEPAEKDYCIRCCKNSADCPTGRSAAGCQSIIPGTYSLILELDSPLTKQAGAKSVVSYAATSDKKVIWTPPTRQEYNSNATLRAALEKAVFPIGVGLDQPVN